MDIFGGVGLKAILPLIQNYDLFKDLQARANQELESGALLAAEFDIQANSLSGTITVFRNSLKALGKVIGDDLAPYVSLFLKTFIEGVRTLVEGWRSLNPSIKFAIFLMGSLLAAVGPLALLLNTLFIAPISGLITFITFLTKANLSIGLTSILTKAGSTGVFSFGRAFATVTPAIIGFTQALGVMLLGLGKILLVVGLVAGAVYLLGKALGIGLKFPSMPEIKLPKYGKVATPKTTGEAEAIEEATKADKEAAKKKSKELTKELRDKRKARDKELKILEQGIDEYEKIRKAELKERQKLVDAQKDALDIKKEQWEDEKRMEDEKIRMQQDTLDNVKKTLKESKKALDELKKVYDDELDTAENGVDFAEMNLDAAQEALKREKLLGRDEYDESLRLAEARVKAWEQAVQLAKENVIKVKREYQEQINIQEEIVDVNQEQVDLQTDALDDLKDALAERRAIVDKEIDLMDDELKIRQRALNDIKESTQEKLDILRDEKSARKSAWEDELDILQDRLDTARDYADEISGMSLPELPELPDIAGHLGELDSEIKNQMNEIAKGFEFGLELTPGGLLEDFKKAWEGAKEIAETEGGSAGIIYVEAMYNSMAETTRGLLEPYNKFWADFLFGEGTWENLNKRAEDEGKSLVKYLWDGFISEIKEIPTKVRESMEKNFIQPIKNLFPQFFRTGQEGGEKTKEGLLTGGKGTEQIGTNVIQNFIKGLRNYGGMWSVFSNIRNAIWKNLGTMGSSAWSWGYNLVQNYKRGMEAMGNTIKSTAEWIGNLIKDVWESLSPPKEGPLKNIDKWGTNLVKTYADSMIKGMPYLEQALENVSGGLGTNFAGNAAAAIPATTPATSPTPAGTIINKNYYIQPGQMIASRGEVRNFVRILKEYDKFEEER